MVLFDVCVEWVIHNYLIVDLVVYLYMWRWIDFGDWRVDADAADTGAFVHLVVDVVVLETRLFLLGNRSCLRLLITPLSIVWSWLADGSNIILNTVLRLMLVVSILILNISIARCAFIVYDWAGCLLNLLIQTPIFLGIDGCGRCGISIELGGVERVPNRDAEIFQVVVAPSTILGLLIPLEWFAASTHELSRGYVVHEGFIFADRIGINGVESLTAPSGQLWALSHLILLSFGDLGHHVILLVEVLRIWRVEIFSI